MRAEKRFGVAEARRLRDALEMLAPVRDVTIDFSGAHVVDDAALSIVADILNTTAGCRFELTGLTRHRRRLLRYMGVAAPAAVPMDA